MKGDKGNCQIIAKGGKMVLKTKFDNETNCKARIKTLLGLGVITEDVKPYKCQECKMIHMGNSQERKAYGLH